jgi:pyridoxal phosphate enzyme (YggS family)
MIRENLNSVRERIKSAALRAGRKAEDITLVCVVKEADIEGMREAIAGGITDIGENTVQAALAKYAIFGGESALRWHFIGHLQTNKVKNAVRIFNLIHSVDSIRLAEAIQKEAEKLDKTQEILLQVNVSGEESKYGLSPAEIKEVLQAIRGMKNLALTGLMTIAPYSDNAKDLRRYFRKLRELRDGLARSYSGIRHLSMGMSGDFEVAIEEGADIVRIGTAIFGRGKYAK